MGNQLPKGGWHNMPYALRRRGRRSITSAQAVRAAAKAAVEPLEGRTLLSSSIGPQADAYVLSSDADPSATNTNFGNAGQLRVQAGPGIGAQSFLRFSIDSLSGVSKAMLRLHGGVSAETSVGVWRLSDTWSEDQVTNTDQPSVIGGAVDSAHVAGTGDYYFDVSSIVRDALEEGKQFVSFALRQVGGSDQAVTFSSREGGDDPRLIVEEDVDGPVGTFNLRGVDAAVQATQVVVTYSDTDAIDLNTIDDNDIEVSVPGGGALRASSHTINAANPNSVEVTYNVVGPGGSWGPEDNDNGQFYTVFVRGDEVKDVAGNSAAGGPNEFLVNVADNPPPPPQDTVAPTVAIDAVPTVTGAGGTTLDVFVTASDNVAILAESLQTADLVITSTAAGAAPLTVLDVSREPNANAASIRAHYMVQAPGGSWGPEDNGTYTVTFVNTGALDTSNNASASVSTTFTVDIPNNQPPPVTGDGQGPTVEIDDDGGNVTTAGGTTKTIKVKFQDDDGIDLTTIDAGDLRVATTSRPSLVVTNVSTDANGSGKRAEVTFTLAAPGGSWDAADNGSYQIQVVDGAVADVGGARSGQVIGSFDVSIAGSAPPPADAGGPGSAVAAQQALTIGDTTERLVKVTYTDDVGIDLSSINAGDITVTGPGGQQLQVIDVSASPPGGGKVVTATYVVAAPGGTWDSADNGAYTITVPAGAVRDVNGNASAAASGAFQVAVPAPPPVIDPGFGNGTSQVSTGFVAEAAVAQPDGKIVIVGRQGDLSTGSSRSVVQRLNENGTLDTSFGTGGTVVGPDGLNEAFYSVVLTADGNILAAGTQSGNFVVARFKPTGAIDNKFGEGGRATADFGSDDTAYGVALAADGSVVTSGGSNGHFAFARFNADGSADQFFGDRGRALFADVAGGGNIAAGAVVQSDGKIVAVGPNGQGGVTLVRINPNGSEDLSFGTGGALNIQQLATAATDGRPDRTIGINLQDDGRILVNNRSANGDFAIVRATATGALDNSFGGDGLITVDFGGNDDADVLLVQGTGEIYAVGTTDAGGGPKAAVAAIDSAGALVQKFGTGGKLTVEANVTSPGRELRVGDLVLRAFGSVAPDGRLVIGTSDQAARATTSSQLRKLSVPGSSLVGRFGVVPGSKKVQKLTFQDADGTVVTITLKGGSGQAFTDASGNVDLVLTGMNVRSALSITAKGGDGKFVIRDVMSDGAIKSFTGKNTDIAGTFSAKGLLGKMSFHTLSGTVASAGAILSLALSGDLTGQLLSGTDFGSDGKFGGTETAADTFVAGQIGKISVKGQVSGATVAAGLNPVDNRMLDDNDRVEGGQASTIGSIAVKGGTDDATRFVAGRFTKSAKLPEKVVNPGVDEDPRFLLM